MTQVQTQQNKTNESIINTISPNNQPSLPEVNVNTNPYNIPYDNDYPSVWDQEHIDQIKELYILKNNFLKEDNIHKKDSLSKKLLDKTMTFFAKNYAFNKKSFYEERNDLLFLLFDLLYGTAENSKKFPYLKITNMLIERFSQDNKNNLEENQFNSSMLEMTDKNVLHNFSLWVRHGYTFKVLNRRYEKSTLRFINSKFFALMLPKLVFDNEERELFKFFKNQVQTNIINKNILYDLQEKEIKNIKKLDNQDLLNEREQEFLKLKEENERLVKLCEYNDRVFKDTEEKLNKLNEQNEEGFTKFYDEVKKFEAQKKSIIISENLLIEKEKNFAAKENKIIEIEKTLWSLEKEFNAKRESFEKEKKEFEETKQILNERELHQVTRQLAIDEKEKSLTEKELELKDLDQHLKFVEKEISKKKVKADSETINNLTGLMKELEQEISFIDFWSKKKQKEIGRIQLFLKEQTQNQG